MDDHATSENPATLRDASRGQRLQRVMADAGVASRRACEQLIESGHVTVNGAVVRTLPAWVDPARDHIRVNGRALEKPEPHLYLMFNKPARTLATPREGPDDARRSVIDMVSHPLSARLFPAGRLDFDATGLLLLTNDGDLANRLTHARYGVDKTYQMVVRGTLDDASLERVNKVIGQVTRRAAKEAGAPHPARSDLVILAREPGRTVLELSSRDGRAVLVRDTLAALGHPVKKMERVAIGPVRLRGVAVGHWRELEREELSQLRRVAAGKPAQSPARTAPRPAVTDQTSAAPAVPRRRPAKKRARRPLISKRFRGIGQAIETDARGKARDPDSGRGRGRSARMNSGRGSAPLARSRPDRAGGRPTRGNPNPTGSVRDPGSDRSRGRPARSDEPAAPIDRRRGRSDAINAYRRKRTPDDSAAANAQRKQAQPPSRPGRPSNRAPDESSTNAPRKQSPRPDRPARQSDRPPQSGSSSRAPARSPRPARPPRRGGPR